MTDQPPPSPEFILQIGMGFWASKALLTAVELGLFTVLAEGPQGAEALKARLGLQDRGTRDFLDALVAMGMLARTDGLYANSPATDFYLDRAKPSYIGGLLEMANRRLYPFWGGLTEALKTGRPQNEAKSGGDPFSVMYADPGLLESFLKAMTGVSLGAAHAIAGKFPWKDYKSFADIGCAQGGCAATIAGAHPHLTGIGFDLEPVRPVFEAYVRQNGLSDRLRFEAGNFFTGGMPRVDVLVMGHILHDWDLDQKRMLLRKAYDSLPSGGAVLVYDAVIDDDRRQNLHGLLMSLNMLIETPGGFDYTGADCVGWMQEAGFREARVEHLVGPDSMVIGFK